MKVATIFSLLLVSASAFTAPQFATRAVGKAPATRAVKKVAPKKKAPATKVAVKKAPAKKFTFGAKKAAPKKAVPQKAAPKKAAPKKAALKKVAPKKAALKKVVPKKAASKKVAPKKKVLNLKGATSNKAPPASKGYPSFAAKAQSFKLGKVSGGGAGREISPVFLHPTVNTEPAPSFDYKAAALNRKTPQSQEFVYDDGLTILERRQKSTIPSFLTGSAKSNVQASEVRTDIEEQEYPFGLSGDRFQLLFISVFSLFTLVGCLSGTVQLD
jgi:hypothetical protein